MTTPRNGSQPKRWGPAYPDKPSMILFYPERGAVTRFPRTVEQLVAVLTIGQPIKTYARLLYPVCPPEELRDLLEFFGVRMELYSYVKEDNRYIYELRNESNG